MSECEKCGYFCESSNSLIKHQQTAEICSKYEDHIFICRKCNFNTKGLHIIENHPINSSDVIQTPLVGISSEELIEEKRILVIKNSQFENKLRDKDILIMELKLRLQFEEMKNTIYTNIIKTHTNIEISDIIQEKTNEVHIFNFENGKIPIVVHDFVKNTKEYTIELKKKRKNFKVKNTPILVVEDELGEITEKPKKKIYRSVKEYNKITEKKREEQHKKDIIKVEKKIDKIVYENYDVSLKNTKEKLETLFETIVKSRTYSVHLASARRLREKLLGKLSLEDYTSLILYHIEKCQTIFKNRKFQNRKIQKIITTSLTPLENRLSYHVGYTNVNIGPDEVQQFGLALQILIKSDKKFVPHNKNTFVNNVKNYSLALFEIKDCIERCIVNQYGFHNLIYIPKPKTIDPFSFYSLATINNNIRCWKMECRLEDYSEYFADTILVYCISLFRKIYKDVFHDNIYRPNYMDKSQITEYDCEQLIQNIITLSRPITFCELFKNIIITKCIITTTGIDKFDLYADDKIQQKRLASAKDLDENTCHVMKRLFDNINHEDSLHIITSR
jgi:hypothetical protein